MMDNSAPGTAAEPLRYEGAERADPTYADGRLRPVVGVHNIQVFRAGRAGKPEGYGYTYNHAPMLAYWRGHFYLEYLSAPVSEHEAPCHTLLTRSPDGLHWETPQVILPAFPLAEGQFTVAHQRMGFYVAPTGRLLVLGFYGHLPNPNDGTGVGRAVREVYEGGGLGPLYFLRYNRHAGYDERHTPYPFYRTSPDAGFVAACESLLAHKLMTQQWWEEDRAQDGFFAVAGDETFSAKALSFYHRADGMAVGVWKGGYAALSADEGHTWSKPVRCPTIAETYAKLWGQRTSDGRYALVYDPCEGWQVRRPLAVVTSSDGARYAHMLAVHGETPVQRYVGGYKDIGPQYIRGIAEGNGTPPDGAMWLTYSVNKEDIWVSRVPVPITGTVTGPVQDRFAAFAPGALVPGWNIYSPLWSPVAVVEEGGQRVLELRQSDPYDYARAVRVFTPSARATVALTLRAAQEDAGPLEIELLTAQGARPVRLALAAGGVLTAQCGQEVRRIATYAAGQWLDLKIVVNAPAGVFAVAVDGHAVLEGARLASAATAVERLSLRTGTDRSLVPPWRLLERGDADVYAAEERMGPRTYHVAEVTVSEE
jgi:hypothetical protein